MQDYIQDYQQRYHKAFYMVTMKLKHEEMLYHMVGIQALKDFYHKLITSFRKAMNQGEAVYLLPHNLFLFYLPDTDKLKIMKRIYDLDDLVDTIAIDQVSHTLSESFGITHVLPFMSYYQALDYTETARHDPKDYPKYSTSFSFFDYEYYQLHRENLHIQSMLEAALIKEEFIVYLQPKVSLSTGHILGAEALIRWVHNGVMIPLSKYMPILSATSLIRRIDLYVFHKVCRLQTLWRKQHLPDLTISVNISKESYEDGPYYLGELRDAIRQYSLDTRYIELELQEDILFHQDDYIKIFVQRLHEEGFQVALDDFGSRNASLISLLQVNLDTIKLDQAFFKRPLTKSCKKILTHTVTLLKELDKQVVAEGVETKEYHDLLKELHCDAIQGYYYYPPMPIEDFIALLKRDSA